jgi:hypothetical protein
MDTNGFIPFRLPLVDALSISFPGGMRVFLFLGLAGNLSCFFNQTNNIDTNKGAIDPDKK